MKKNCLFLILLIFFSFSINGNLLALPIEEPTVEQPEGEGTAEDPYKIANLNNLYWLSQNQEHWNKHYIQTAENIDATAVASLDGGKGFIPIGKNFSNSFTGTYNGQGHTISNLFIDRPNTDNVGLFGYVKTEDAKIENLSLINATITGKKYVGGLVGLKDNGTIINSYSEGNINGNDMVGGLVGRNLKGIVNNSYSTGNVTGENKVGGLVGYNDYGTITNSYSTGSVTVDNVGGGLVGENNYGTISNSYSQGNVTGQSNVGGFIGINDYGTITNSYSTGSVTGYNLVGGLGSCGI